MNKVEYRNYLNSDHWHDFKTMIKVKYGCIKCGVCGSTKNTNIHHLNYNHLGKEKLSDVVVLCRYCHKKYHDGEITEDVIKHIAKHRKLFSQPYKTIKLQGTKSYKYRKDTSRMEESARKVIKGWVARSKAKERDDSCSIKKLGTVEFYRRKREGLL
jgi:Na+-translocating ferredoxin:NAD+ oxidoreductase RnfC subunit